MRKNIIICTIKEVNIKAAEELRERLERDYDVYIVTAKEKLCSTAYLMNPEYIFFPHWSEIIPRELYEKYNCVVFHMTDLPFGRGGSPLQNLIVRGFKETKISAIKVVKELDAGPIYLKDDLDLSGSATEIFDRSSKIIFEKMIPQMLYTGLVPVEQTGEVTVFKRRKPYESELNNDMSIDKIYDYIRMLDAEGYPKAFIQFGNYRLEFNNARYVDGSLMSDVKFVEGKNE